MFGSRAEDKVAFESMLVSIVHEQLRCCSVSFPKSFVSSRTEVIGLMLGVLTVLDDTGHVATRIISTGYENVKLDKVIRRLRAGKEMKDV